MKEAGPSTPVLLLGLNGAPQAGDMFNVMSSEKEAKELAKKLFNEDELSYIAGNGPSRKKSEMQRSFYEIWTAKEAYLKYLGSGISGGVNTLSFSLKNSKLVPNKNDIKLTYDFSVPGAVTAIVTPND